MEASDHSSDPATAAELSEAARLHAERGGLVPPARPAVPALDEHGKPLATGMGRHANVELESGPVSREQRGDPMPEAP